MKKKEATTQLPEEAAEIDVLLSSVRSIDQRVAIYEDMVTILQKKRMELVAKLEVLAVGLRRMGAPSAIQFADGRVTVKKAAERTEFTDKGAFRDAIEKKYPGTYAKAVFDETAAKNSMRWTPRPEGSKGKFVADAIDPADGEIIPGVHRVFPGEDDYSVSISTESPFKEKGVDRG